MDPSLIDKEEYRRYLKTLSTEELFDLLASELGVPTEVFRACMDRPSSDETPGDSR